MKANPTVHQHGGKMDADSARSVPGQKASVFQSRGQDLQSRATGGSALKAYQELVIGSDSWLDLLRHEIIGNWGAIIPGAVGLAFRKLLWPKLFAQCGASVVWGRNIVIRHPANMWIGDGVLVDDNCYLDAKGNDVGEYRIENGAILSRSCIVSGKGGPVRIGARANLGAGCVLYSFGGLEIGADTLLAANCYIGGGHYDHRGRIDVPMSKQPLPGSGVIIEENCWLGAGVVVIDGVRIGTGSVVGAGAVVTRDLPAHSIAAGVPARVRDSRGPVKRDG